MNSTSELTKDKRELDKIESKDIFKNLKCDYFLQKLLNNLLKKKSLYIIKYNKNIQKRINISIKDYKEYSEKYSSIEIEIKLVKNSYINLNKINAKYYHIYLNNDKEEAKRNNKKEYVEKLKLIIDYQIKSFAGFFKNCKHIENISFIKFYRNNINNMRAMFFGCSSLKELNISNFNTINVECMRNMFSKCSSLKELNLSNFNTINVKNMQNMFSECSSLRELNFSNFNTNNIYMEFMFYGCSNDFIDKIRVQYKNIKEEAFADYE